MLRKKFICLLLIMVFAIPLAPVMQVGAFLYTNQLSEEHSAHGLFLVKKGDATEQENAQEFLLLVRISSRQHNYHMDERLFSRQADDITTPPPNIG